jgi:hypothetical protein
MQNFAKTSIKKVIYYFWDSSEAFISNEETANEALNFESRYLWPTMNALKSKNCDSMQTLCRQSVYRKSQNSCIAFYTRYDILFNVK